MNYKIFGAGIGILGFALLSVGAFTILGVLSATPLVTDLVVVLGVALLVVGCGIFGKEWAKKMPKVSISVNAKWSVIVTFVATVVVALTSLWGYAAGNDIWTAAAVGALGGLVHEISQSKGTAFLPDQSGKQGESYLGGLVGIILGGAAGLLVGGDIPKLRQRLELLQQPGGPQV
jgi:uncharacterized membrane protein